MGLTVAEIFILLLFLLLLLFITLDRHWETQSNAIEAELKENKEALGILEKKLHQWSKVMEEFKAPDEVVTLKRQLVEAQGQVKEYERDALLYQKLETLEGDAIQLARELKNANEAREQERQKAASYQEQLRVLRTKGHNPPCWYQVIPDGKGGMREKPYYTLDMAVFDDNIVLRSIEPPPGKAEDDGGQTYTKEATNLQLDMLPFGQPLSDDAIQTLLAPIHASGQRKEIRTYPCIFWVRVWDKTSEGAKKRWQRAHDDIIEGLFGAYTVKDLPW